MMIIKRVANLLGDIGFIVGIGILAFLSLSIGVEVFSRYAMGHSSIWVTEVSGYLIAGLLFMPLGKVYREGGHVNMSVINEHKRPKLKKSFVLISDICVLIFGFFLVWVTWEMVALSYNLNWKSSTILSVPLYLPQAFMPIGSIIFVAEIIGKIMNDLFIDKSNIIKEA